MRRGRCRDALAYPRDRACVAAVTQGELDRGRREVHLSTDLANPTSNAIYTAIGYLPVGDEQVWHFDA